MLRPAWWCTFRETALVVDFQGVAWWRPTVGLSGDEGSAHDAALKQHMDAVRQSHSAA